MRLAVDSSVWIDYYRGAGQPHEHLLETAFDARLIVVPNFVLLEVLRGVPSEKVARSIERDFAAFECFDIVGRQIHIAAAANYRKLRSAGKTIRSSVDLLIGTWCIENNVPLLHNDRDFDVIEKELGLGVLRELK